MQADKEQNKSQILPKAAKQLSSIHMYIQRRQLGLIKCVCYSFPNTVPLCVCKKE
jgi:hypothetical protein